MPVDTLICGQCQLAFHDINQFMQHKKDSCDTVQHVPQTAEEIEEAQTQTIILNIGEPLMQKEGQEEMCETMLMEVSMDDGTCENFTGDIVNAFGETIAPQPGIELVPVDRNASNIPGTDLQIIVKSSSDLNAQNVPVRKRGRPRKGEGKNKVKSETVASVAEEKPVPEIAADGRLHCTRCKKYFTKERHFKTHKCLADTDYVDITKKEVVSSLDEEIGEESDEEFKVNDVEEDDEEEYKQLTNKPPKKSGRGRGRPPLYPKLDIPPVAITPNTEAGELLEAAGHGGGLLEQGTGMGPSQSTDGTALTDNADGTALVENTEVTPAVGNAAVDMGDAGTNQQSDDYRPKRGRKKKDRSVKVEPVDLEEDLEVTVAGDKIANKPVFSDLEEKAKFDTMLNIDLTIVDHMFKTHVIDQDVNENAPPPSSRTQDRLSVFSCNECDKVFMSLSHVRLHCLIHTDLKPFQCTKCDYSTNTKGNLYTHMRRHTGQLYQCPDCTFRTVNKGHLVEHQAIHNTKRYLCKICKRDYNTPKSLLNHVRKYHNNSAKGKEYLTTFQGKHNRGPAVLHQCHVCNRKFKKKNDRDRHLVVHNIHNTEQLYQCGVCDYMSTRRGYLEKHISRHRIIYTCYICEKKFPSTVRLNQHLSDLHTEGEIPDESWREMFNQCLDVSLFLPEPDGSMDFWMQNEEAQLQDQLAPESETQVMSEPQVVSEITTDAVEDGQVQLITPGLEESEEAMQQVTNLDENQDFEEITAMVVPGEEESLKQTSTLDEEQNMDVNDETDIMEWAKKLGYRPMGSDVFQKLRQAFGNEECEYCGRLFYNKVDYDAHIRIHTGEKPFACSQCSFRSITRENLRRHSEREHEKVVYTCDQCEFVGNTRAQLWTHSQKHKTSPQVNCSKCNMVFDSYKKMKIHLQIKHQDLTQVEKANELATFSRLSGKYTARKTYPCPYCHRLFNRASSDLQKHIWIHEGIKPFVCPEAGCGHACRSKSNLSVHMLKHSAHKPYNCGVCNKGYKSKTALRWHVRSHKDGKIFKCDKCPYEATQKSHLKRHSETHEVVKRYTCSHCDYSANTVGYMKIHYTRHHKGQTYVLNQSIVKPISSETKVYKCLSCDYLFGNLSDMKRHLKVRHHVQVEEMRSLDNPDFTSAHVVPIDEAGPHIPQSEIQVVHLQDPSTDATAEEQDATSALQALQYAGSELDEKTASAVNIIQQIMDMSQQQQQQITIQQEDGQQSMVAVNPETIIVQQHGEEVVVSSNPEYDGSQQYVIQYIHDPMEESIEGTVVTSEHQILDIPQTETTQESVEATPEQIEIVQESVPDHVVLSQTDDMIQVEHGVTGDDIQIDSVSMEEKTVVHMTRYNRELEMAGGELEECDQAQLPLPQTSEDTHM